MAESGRSTFLFRIWFKNREMGRSICRANFFYAHANFLLAFIFLCGINIFVPLEGQVLFGVVAQLGARIKISRNAYFYRKRRSFVIKQEGESNRSEITKRVTDALLLSRKAKLTKLEALALDRTGLYYFGVVAQLGERQVRNL